jgi:hypothetical protein
MIISIMGTLKHYKISQLLICLFTCSVHNRQLRKPEYTYTLSQHSAGTEMLRPCCKKTAFVTAVCRHSTKIPPEGAVTVNPLNAELNPICHLLALLGVHFSLRPLACWDRGFESHRGHGYLSVVSAVCCQVEVSATSWSLVQRSPADCGASLCVI